MDNLSLIRPFILFLSLIFSLIKLRIEISLTGAGILFINGYFLLHESQIK